MYEIKVYNTVEQRLYDVWSDTAESENTIAIQPILRQKLGAFHSLEFKINDNHPLFNELSFIVDSNNLIPLVYENGVNVFVGTINKLQNAVGEEYSKRFVINDYLSTFQNYIWIQDKKGDDGWHHIDSYLSVLKQKSGVDISRVDTTKFEHKFASFEVADYWAVLRTFQNKNKMFWRVMFEGGKLYLLFEDVGIETQQELSYNKQTIEKATIEYDFSEIKNKIYARGAQLETPPASAKDKPLDKYVKVDFGGGKDYCEDVDSIDQFGLHEEAWIDNRYTNVEELKNDAYERLEKYKLPKPLITIDKFALELLFPNQYEKYSLGDWVSFVEGKYEVSERIRVYEKFIELDEPFKPTLSFTNIESNYLTDIKELQEELQKTKILK